ncbi:hypothetical protein MCOR03_003784 [Pyricularia oryzae]|nr:hypothetical protein MCOR03_003784 [Pyricularia oryzae]
MQMLKWDFMRDTGACLAPASVQQLCVGLETLARGLNTLLTFGLSGGEAEGLVLIDALEFVTNTPNVRDCRTIVGQHWFDDAMRSASAAEMENMGRVCGSPQAGGGGQAH